MKNDKSCTQDRDSLMPLIVFKDFVDDERIVRYYYISDWEVTTLRVFAQLLDKIEADIVLKKYNGWECMSPENMGTDTLSSIFGANHEE